MNHENAAMHIIVFVTTKDTAEAEKISRALLDRKLAACVNIIGKAESRFWWQGKIDNATESLLIIKSRKELFPEIEAAVKVLHSYDVPEIIAVDISAGSPDYLKWIDESVSR